MKPLTNAQRIASVDFEIRDRIIYENHNGVSMKHLAVKYRLSEKTVRVIIHASKENPVYALPRPLPDDLWNQPHLWHRHGLKGPTTPRMVDVVRSQRRS